MKIKYLHQKKEPFAIVQYFEWFKTSKSEKTKKYELLYLSKDKSHVKYLILDSESTIYFKSIINELYIVFDNNDGKVWDFNSFKDYKELHNAHK